MMSQIVVLAGGLGTRLKHLTTNIPKILVPVAGKPFVLHQIDLLKSHGFSDFVFCVGHYSDQIVELLGDGSEFGVRIQYSYDGNQPAGTGGALYKAKDLLADKFFLIYGDSYLRAPYDAIANYFESQSKEVLMTVFDNGNNWDASNVIFAEGEILSYMKGVKDDARYRYIDYGLSAFKKSGLSRYWSAEPHDLTKIFYSALEDKNLAGYEVHDRFFEIGSFDGIKDFEKYLLAQAL